MTPFLRTYSEGLANDLENLCVGQRRGGVARRELAHRPAQLALVPGAGRGEPFLAKEAERVGQLLHVAVSAPPGIHHLDGLPVQVT